MLRRAALNLASAGYPGRMVLADARRLPFRPESFDSSTVTFPTPVIRDPAFWSELARILRPGGRVVVVLAARSGQVGKPTIVEFFGRVIGRKVGPPDLVAAQPVRRELSLPVPTNCFGIQQIDVEVDRSLVTLLIATKLPETGGS